VMSQRSSDPHQECFSFSQLPKELRLSIWEAAAILPRVVRLKLYDDGSLRPHNPPPALLLVCREASEVSLKIYTKRFGTVLAPPSTWFSYDHDTLYLDNTFSKYLCLLHFDAIHVKHLAIHAKRSNKPTSAFVGNYFWDNDYLHIETLIRTILKVFTN
jgi:hypothetical protein